jgi:hypothetical protein
MTPAMSRCAQGVSPANRSMSFAPVIEPAPRPPVFGDQPAAGEPTLRAVKPEND